jgi:hypothetical protein
VARISEFDPQFPSTETPPVLVADAADVEDVFDEATDEDVDDDAVLDPQVPNPV